MVQLLHLAVDCYVAVVEQRVEVAIFQLHHGRNENYEISVTEGGVLEVWRYILIKQYLRERERP